MTQYLLCFQYSGRDLCMW